MGEAMHESGQGVCENSLKVKVSHVQLFANPWTIHCRWILYQLSHKGNPRILECVAYPFSRGSSWPRNQTGVSCIAGRFFTNWELLNLPFNLVVNLKLLFKKSSVKRKITANERKKGGEGRKKEGWEGRREERQGRLKTTFFSSLDKEPWKVITLQHPFSDSCEMSLFWSSIFYIWNLGFYILSRHAKCSLLVPFPWQGKGTQIYFHTDSSSSPEE